MENNMIAVLKKCGSVVFSLLLIVCLLPVFVLAESSTYRVAEPDLCFSYSGSGSTKNYNLEFVNVQSEVRYCLIERNGIYSLVFVSDQPFQYYNVTYSNTCSTYLLSSSHCTGDNCIADYYYLNEGSIAGIESSNPGLVIDRTIPTNPVLTNWSKNYNINSAYYYCFGDGQVAPSVDWGILQSPAYSTSIAGSGEASAANIDTVTWSLPYDTNNNDISESGVVDVRVVRGKWAGESAEALQGKDYSEFSLEQSGANLGTVPASQGSFTASWSNVMQALDMASLLLLLSHKITGDTWEKDGWIYQIRLRVPDDDYTGEWQTVYTATSTSVNGSDTIINSTSYNIDVNQAFTEITQVNNNTSITYTYLDTDINIENPDAGTEPEGGTDLWDILKQIINGLYQILVKLGDIAKSISNFVSNLLDGLFDMIRDLFLPQEVDEEVTINFNDRMQEIKGRSGLFGEALDFERQLYNQLFGISEPEPIITWPDLTYDDVTYIEGGSINLKDFIDHEGASSTYAFFRTLISGAIYYLLFLNILKKLKEVINK